MHNTKKNSYKTIRIYESSFILLDEYSKKYSASKTEMIELFLLFFHKTKIDPRNTLDTSAEVKKLKSQLISFIKTQEKDILIPMMKKQDVLIDKFLSVLDEELVDKKFIIETLNEFGKQLIKNFKNDN